MAVNILAAVFKSFQIEQARLRSFAVARAALLLSIALFAGTAALAQSNKANEHANPAPPNQMWAATSNTAVSITGNILLTSQAITISHKQFPIEFVREIDKQDLNNNDKLFEPFMRYTFMKPLAARLYKTLISRNVKFLNGNTICGPNADATWMLAAFAKDNLSLAFFSSTDEPNLDYKVVEVSHDLCGTFTYVDPKRMLPLTAGDGSIR